MTQEQHFDVAAYALGVLDTNDAAHFEDHLIDCPTCAMELESLLPVVDLLSDLDADSIVATEQSRNDGVVLQRMIGEVAKERRRANSRRLYSLAASVVVFAMLSIGALFAGAKWLPGQGSTPNAPVAAPSVAKTLDPITPGGDIGGGELKGDPKAGTDPRTGARLNYTLETKPHGTLVSFAMSNVTGPKLCYLVAVQSNGQQVRLSTWNVGPDGWGTAKQPNVPALTATTALPADQIAHLQVQAVDQDGKMETLVSV